MSLTSMVLVFVPVRVESSYAAVKVVVNVQTLVYAAVAEVSPL